MRRAVLALSVCTIGSSAPRAHGAHDPVARTIGIEHFAFAPTEVRVSLGDTVVWLNQDPFKHTTTADSAAWSSPELESGQRFSLVAARQGRFSYHCAAHPVMRGVIIVQGRQ